jgi:hypothetical protein
MKEVQRLDTVVQNHKIQVNYDTEDCERVEISKVKRELFKEIENLNTIKQDDIQKPKQGTLKQLYHQNKRRRIEQKTMKDQKENNYLAHTSNLLADVTAAVEKHENTRPCRY